MVMGKLKMKHKNRFLLKQLFKYHYRQDRSVGVYWQNSAETWVDIHNTNSEKNVMSTIVDFVAGNRQTEPPVAHFMSESGILDVFILMGPLPNDLFRQ